SAKQPQQYLATEPQQGQAIGPKHIRAKKQARRSQEDQVIELLKN
ncbi:9813_t:CDS:1, partial [Funneliformis mosseae]